MGERELDSVLEVIQNPVRRRIIKRLSEEPCYALQLSKELGLGQPLVAKHLSVMEEAGMVSSVTERSPSGPRRKRYSLARSVSITMDVAPHLFKERAVVFPEPGASSARDPELGSKVAEALKSPADKADLALISGALGEIDGRIEEIEEERVGLLSTRNQLMTIAAQIVSDFEDQDTKRVVFHILEENDREVESISQSLDMREMVVRAILDDLERDLFG